MGSIRTGGGSIPHASNCRGALAHGATPHSEWVLETLGDGKWKMHRTAVVNPHETLTLQDDDILSFDHQFRCILQSFYFTQPSDLSPPESHRTPHALAPRLKRNPTMSVALCTMALMSRRPETLPTSVPSISSLKFPSGCFWGSEFRSSYNTRGFLWQESQSLYVCAVHLREHLLCGHGVLKPAAQDADRVRSLRGRRSDVMVMVVGEQQRLVS